MNRARLRSTLFVATSPILVACFLLGATILGRTASAADASFEGLSKGSVAVYDLKETLRPFVATCGHHKTYFRRLFCTALNERLKAQHQSKLYRLTVEASADGPLVARFRAKPKPTLDTEIRGCLTCKGPMLDRKGGDISKARFFVFKLPKTVNIRRGRGSRYDLGDLTLAKYSVELPKKTTEKTFKDSVLPHLRAELIYRPVAGVTRVGGRFKYGFITYELAGHRVYHKCNGKVYGAEPKAKGGYKVDKNDWTCPQNRPKKLVKAPKLPSRMPQAEVKALMDGVTGDLHTCYNQFGLAGDVPTEIVIVPTGKVKQVRIAGKLAGTPAAECVTRLIKHLQFPKFSGNVIRLRWPFTIEEPS